MKVSQPPVGLVFRVVNYEAGYNDDNDRTMTDVLKIEPEYNALYKYFDCDSFSLNLLNVYVTHFY